MDLILERFLSKHLNSLSEEELLVYDNFLLLSDNEFLDLVMERAEPQELAELHLLQKIRNS